MSNGRIPSFSEWKLEKEPENGILVFLDKGDKYNKTQHSLCNLLHNCDIKIDSQVVDGEYRWLLIEVSPKGSLDRETFERDPNAPVCCRKCDYEITFPDDIFRTTRGVRDTMNYQYSHGIYKTYIAEQGRDGRIITEEEYNDPNYVF